MKKTLLSAILFTTIALVIYSFTNREIKKSNPPKISLYDIRIRLERPCHWTNRFLI